MPRQVSLCFPVWHSSAVGQYSIQVLSPSTYWYLERQRINRFRSSGGQFSPFSTQLTQKTSHEISSSQKGFSVGTNSRLLFLISVNVPGRPHDEVGFSFDQVYSLPAVWIAEEHAPLTLRTHIVTSWKQNVTCDVWRAWSLVALQDDRVHLPWSEGKHTYLLWCFPVSPLCKYQWPTPRKILPLALCRLRTKEWETFCSLLCRYNSETACLLLLTKIGFSINGSVARHVHAITILYVFLLLDAAVLWKEFLRKITKSRCRYWKQVVKKKKKNWQRGGHSAGTSSCLPSAHAHSSFLQSRSNCPAILSGW